MGFSLITIFEIINYFLQILCKKMKAHLDMVCPKSCQKECRQSTKDIELENEVADTEDKQTNMDLLVENDVTPTIPCR